MYKELSKTAFFSEKLSTKMYTKVPKTAFFGKKLRTKIYTTVNKSKGKILHVLYIVIVLPNIIPSGSNTLNFIQ